MTATVASAPTSAAPWLGRRDDHRHAAVAGVGALGACAIYASAATAISPEYAPGWLDFTGTFTSLWCVWITQRRNVLAMPIGILSVVLMGAFFLQVDLLGQAALHWAYYVPVQVWGWWAWTRGGEGRTELAVTRLARSHRAAVVVAVVVGTGLFGWLLTTGWASAAFGYWDASIVSASITAQLLLSRKKVEAWWLWIGPVNVSAIGLYVVSAAYMFAALYVLFLVMAVVGLYRWHRAAQAGVP